MIWTHAICRDCYGQLEPGREPVLVPPDETGAPKCCFCGEPTIGPTIYYRAHPAWARHCPEIAR